MQDFPAYADRLSLGGRHGFKALDWHNRGLLAGVPLAGADVLDIGAGEGLLSLWMLHAGARSVVSLEPEAAGSTHGVGGRAAEHRRALGLSEARWSYRAETLQSYKADRKFGVIVSHASINHLDEDACVGLLTDAGAQARYRAIFRHIADLMTPGGHFVITDCGRENYWARAGWASPWSPEIEWHKHQEPETWARHLSDAGLTTVRLRWRHHFYRLRALTPFLETRMASRCIASSFALTVRRPSAS
jgi:SAM-dependent methyltransferase